MTSILIQRFIDWPLRIKISDFLNIIILKTSFFDFDVWALVHLFTGAIIIGVLLKFKKLRNKTIKALLILIALLILYEIIEAAFYLFIIPELFIPETFLNAFIDVIIGTIGALIIIGIIKKLKKVKRGR